MALILLNYKYSTTGRIGVNASIRPHSTRSSIEGVISWGIVAWELLDSKVIAYEINPNNKAFFIQRGYIHRPFLLPFAGQESGGESNP